jgi:retron-type reverse transcriptase
MSKTNHNLWEKIVQFENLYIAWNQARLGKRKKANVAEFSLNLEENLFTLQEELISGNYHPGPYHHFFIHEPKKRLISAASFRDRVVHHALCNLLIPIYGQKFIEDTYANRVDKGTHKAITRAGQFSPENKYVLPLDVQQFFPSVDHDILITKLKVSVQDSKTINLCQQILSSGKDTHDFNPNLHFFPEDDLSDQTRPRGLPIGNLTSQFWANVYLNDLDHFIKEKLQCKGYLRYVDDLLLFSDNKPTLHQWHEQLSLEFLHLRLKLHENRAIPKPTISGIPFLGFQIFPTHKRLKRRNVVHAFQRVKHLARQYQSGEIDYK